MLDTKSFHLRGTLPDADEIIARSRLNKGLTTNSSQ